MSNQTEATAESVTAESVQTEPETDKQKKSAEKTEEKKEDYVSPHQFFADSDDDDETVVGMPVQATKAPKVVEKQYLDVLAKGTKKSAKKEEKDSKHVVLDTAFLSTYDIIQQKNERKNQDNGHSRGPRHYDHPRSDKPYAERQPRKSGDYQPYVPRQSDHQEGERKPYIPRQNDQQQGERRQYAPRQNRNFNEQRQDNKFSEYTPNQKDTTEHKEGEEVQHKFTGSQRRYNGSQRQPRSYDRPAYGMQQQNAADTKQPNLSLANFPSL